MKWLCTTSALLLLLSACAPKPTPSTELVVVGKLVSIASPPGCGVFHFGAIAEYSDLTILSGDYAGDAIFVIHGCPELARREYAKESGNLEEFHIGDYHELHLTTQNVHRIGPVYPAAEYPANTTYFCDVVNLYE